MSATETLKPQATRQAFGEALAKLGAEHTEVVVLDADLSKSTKSEIFAKKFGDRFFEMGIAEANMIGTAAGLAFTGKLPFLCSFGAFLTGRFDTIRLSCAYAGANVRLVGTHAGVGIGDDGHSQMGLEDLALMRTLPGMGVFQPGDARETHWLMEYLVREWKGPAYLRLTRQNLPWIFEKESDRSGWVPGLMSCVSAEGGPVVSSLVNDFGRVAMIATGGVLGEAVGARRTLGAQQQDVSVWNCHSLKPFDVEGLRRIAANVDWIVTVEDHSVIGGLGGVVAETLAEVRGPRAGLKRLGIQDQFGESGEGFELYDKHGISAAKIAATLKTLR